MRRARVLLIDRQQDRIGLVVSLVRFLRPGKDGDQSDGKDSVKFAFLTGVSKFSEVSLFSDLNNLTDLTLDAAFSAICGYTDADLDTTFAPELPGLDREEIRRWYKATTGSARNGCTTRSTSSNCSSAVGFARTGSRPARRRFRLRRCCGGRWTSPPWTVCGATTPCCRGSTCGTWRRALLFQTGYLTIRDEERAFDGTPLYRLGYPNHEVRRSLNASLLAALTPPDAVRRNPGLTLVERLRARDFAGIEGLVRGLFASIPYEWHTRNEIARYEGYYASVFRPPKARRWRSCRRGATRRNTAPRRPTFT